MITTHWLKVGFIMSKRTVKVYSTYLYSTVVLGLTAVRVMIALCRPIGNREIGVPRSSLP